ncbi:MAG: D-alanyl-D-alanine carboxypeptidase [Actinomycetota bacterium]|nr:D-alanyl-D-alanine carboxypeptidase [Actinomycetota bacterium]
MNLRRLASSVAGALLPLLLVASPVVVAQTGRAARVPPPTPVPPAGSPSPFPTALHTPAPGMRPPTIAAEGAILGDLSTGQVLFSHKPDVERPIASLTKIMTALLALERLDPNRIVTVRPDAAPGSVVGLSELGLRAGERIDVRDLLYGLMLASANDAAIALADAISGSAHAFIPEMNRRASRLGLEDTRFFSPNGLDDRGYSTPHDLFALTRQAYEQPLFARITGTKFADVSGPNGKPRHLQNRNVLLWLYPGAFGVKTGYTRAAGYCVVAAAKREGLSLVSVVLGEPSEAFSDAAALLDYGFRAFEQKTFVDAKQTFDPVQLHGESVPVAAQARLDGLVPAGSAATTRQMIELDPKAPFPPAVGDPVATVEVTVGGAPIGSVPLVATVRPRPPPPPPGGWLSRSLGAVRDAVSDALGALLS